VPGLILQNIQEGVYMSLSLVRVDDRLIHGQVVLMWSKVRQGDAIILLVDDAAASDPFNKMVLEKAGNAIGKKVYVFDVNTGVEKIPKAVAGIKKYYIIAKNISLLYELSRQGVDFGNEIIFGTASKKPETRRVANNIYISKKGEEACDYLTQKNISIIFKLQPDEPGITWPAAKEILNREG